MARERSQRVDIHTVARHARVSVATVSRVVNQVASVDPKLAARVNKAVEELGYTPNTQARALVSGRSRMIGVIVTLITNPFFPELLQSFEDLASQRGYDVLVGSTSYSPDHKLTCIRRMVERKVDGVAMMTFGADEELLQALAERNLPVVSIGSSAVDGVHPIDVDFGVGIHEAVQHLSVLGHRRLAFISGPLRVENSFQRQEAFLEASRNVGIRVPPNYLVEGDHSMESGYEGAERLLSLPNRPTAIVCSNDMTAIGVLHSVSARKLRVPRDISIIGFDDIHMAQFTVPPLTTVRMSCTEVARAALDKLLAAIENRPIETLDPIQTRLIVRQSTNYAPLDPRIDSRADTAAKARPAAKKKINRRPRAEKAGV